jgi:streptogramin lyase
MPDGAITTLLTTYGEVHCIHSSRINGDILVESNSKVTRYDGTGQGLQVIEKDDKGQRLYGLPAYITETYNGDIWVSDYGRKAVVVVDKAGRHRFDYKGRQSEHTGCQSDFYPRGICTNVLGQVLVCDFRNHSVHLLDQDGQFLSLQLTEEQHGIRYPVALGVDNQNNLYLGQDDSNTIKVYKVYKYQQDKNVK